MWALFKRFFSLAAPALESKKALEMMKLEGPQYYAKITLKGRQYTVGQHDVIVTHRLKETFVGDVLKLTQIRELGSRNCTIRGNPLIDPAYCTIRARVIEHGRGKKIKCKKGEQPKGRKKNKTTQPLLTRVHILEINPSI